MTAKRFTVDEGLEDVLCWEINNKENEDMTCGECVKVLNELHEENEHYKSIFFELVETALTDKNCRELYCKGILDIFDKANSLNQARDIIKEHLND